MATTLEFLNITDARTKLSGLLDDSTKETLLMRDGKLVGVVVGLDAWNAIQANLKLLRNPQAFADSLKIHKAFQEQGDAYPSVSLEELKNNLAQGRDDDPIMG